MNCYQAEQVDVIVVGGGHAGCEAALAAARLGLSTILFAISLDSIAMLPCNPCIGGTSKGHLVREIDALGGEMGKVIDQSYLQIRMLNRSKGPAVYSLRAQADKQRYQMLMKKRLEETPGLYIRQGEVTKLLVDEQQTIKGVQTASGAEYTAKAVILCTGTYLRSRCLYGETVIESGPNGLLSAKELSGNLAELGIQLLRFKTGTPARVDKKTVDFSQMTPQYGEEDIEAFSFEDDPEEMVRQQLPCYLTYTNEKTHAVIQENLHRSPLYGGIIKGTGPRYCPSIEDKIVRFADKSRHQVFLEPEGENTNELYVQGMSSSLPEEVQVAMYRTIKGMEAVQITRSAYAIEYDCIDATQLKLSLEHKGIKGLYFAGQINGTSGYEEAAAQGIVAGINAAMGILGKLPLTIERGEGYIGVLIDDIVTKGTREPYRMMTSRAEYRLLLRQDNSEYRLLEKGYQAGLISEERRERFLEKKRCMEEEMARLRSVTVSPTPEIQEFLAALGSAFLQTGVTLAELLKRPEVTYAALAGIDPTRPVYTTYEKKDSLKEAAIEIKYEGYIARQQRQVAQFRKMESRKIPSTLNYDEVDNLRLEARQKLSALRPESIGQASRITGVSPADLTVLLLHLERSRP